MFGAPACLQVDADVSVTRRKETVVVEQKSENLQELLKLQVQAEQELLGGFSSSCQATQTSSPPHSSSSLSAAETSIQQDSKQIQVDLQDLGYETCGRSENEAEREDTSSPGPSDCPHQLTRTHTHSNTELHMRTGGAVTSF